jgi:hypothetical protein
MRMRILLKEFTATIREGEIFLFPTDHREIGYEELPQNLHGPENILNAAKWLETENNKTKAIKKRIFKEDEIFTIIIKYIVE